MRLYSTLSARQEDLHIPTARPLTLYVCGVTPYDTTHVGHARTYLTFDILHHYLRWQGTQVCYTQNVTDVDDPLFERANRDGVAWQTLARDQTDRYVADTAALGIIPPDYFPRASDEIPAMITMIARLLELGHAYQREGNIYFRISSDANFGELARLDYAAMLHTANQRGNNPDDPLKDDPLDFVLWQRGKPGDPAWDAPWGPGRPGWHIECSAMAHHYLGAQIDIHGGGTDLIFPHHACEIAQTEAYTGVRPYVHIWMHTGLVWYQGEKMSKSRGNLVFVRDALQRYHPDILRWYLLSTHYRSDFHYEDEAVTATAPIIATLHAALRATSHGTNGDALDLSDTVAAFTAALNDDLDTPRAFAALRIGARQVLAAAEAQRDIFAARTTLRRLATAAGFKGS